MISVHIIDDTLKIKGSLGDFESNILVSEEKDVAINVVEKIQPDVVLLNFNVAKQNTSNCIRLILTACPKSKIVIVADKLEEEELINCLLAGAKGYQEMQQLGAYAGKLITVVFNGEAWVTRRMVSILLDKLRT